MVDQPASGPGTQEFDQRKEPSGPSHPGLAMDSKELAQEPVNIDDDTLPMPSGACSAPPVRITESQ
jgi:hypothetical protein